MAMNAEKFPEPTVEKHPYRDRANHLLVQMERLIKQDVDDNTARLYNGGDDVYDICRISELPSTWFENEEGIKELEAGVALLQEIIAIQDDPAKSSAEKKDLLAPLLVKLREEYGV